MESFVIVLFCFVVSFILHIAAHRIIRLKSIYVYLVGALLLYGLGRRGLIALPLSSATIYILLSATVILSYFAISLGTEIPSSIILKSFKRKKRQTFKDVTALFTDRGLICDRIDDLMQSKLVRRQEQTLELTGWGNVIWHMMEAYRRVFHRTVTE